MGARALPGYRCPPAVAYEADMESYCQGGRAKVASIRDLVIGGEGQVKG